MPGAGVRFPAPAMIPLLVCGSFGTNILYMSGVNECFVTLVLRPGWSLSALETAKMAAKLEPFPSVGRDVSREIAHSRVLRFRAVVPWATMCRWVKQSVPPVNHREN